MVRRYQSAPLDHRLFEDEDYVLFQGDIIREGLQNSELEFEQKEAFEDYMTETIEAVLRLPPRQRYAMICSLKDKLDDVLPFIDALKNHNVDIERINWPEKKDELQSLRASLSIARKKLQSIKRR